MDDEIINDDLFETETVNFETKLPWLPEYIDVPKDTIEYATIVLSRWSEPRSSDSVNHPINPAEINPRSKRGLYRHGKHCIGIPGLKYGYSGIAILGNEPEIERVLDFMASGDAPVSSGKQLVHLLVARRLAEGNDYVRRSPVQEQFYQTLATAVKETWARVMTQ